MLATFPFRLKKWPAGMLEPDAGAESRIKRAAGAATGAREEPMTKRQALDVGKPPRVQGLDDPDPPTKDRNKWAFLKRNIHTLDPRVASMLEGANRREAASVVNNVVRRGKSGAWEFSLEI